MKKYLTSFIIAAVFALPSVPAYVNAAPLSAAEIGLIANVLLADQDFTQEQVIQVLGLLIAQSENETASVEANKILTLRTGELCGFTYRGDNSIAAVQQELKNQGYDIEKVDGKIGPNTRAAVSAFQTANAAQKIDGLIGEETINLLIKNSLACVGDPGISVNYISSEIQNTEDTGEPLEQRNTSIITLETCSFRYQGDQSIAAVQQELKNQGYDIEKVDGKIGPNTRAAVSAFQSANAAQKIDGLIGQEVRTLLVRNSLICTGSNQTGELINAEQESLNNITENDQTVIVTVDQDSMNANNIVDSEEIVVNDFIVKDEVLSAVRTSGQVTDDTAVFTYRMTLNPDTTIYISSNPEDTFDINIFDASGNMVTTSKVKSIVSSSQRIVRDDRSTYFRVAKGDTLSLRATAQPGAGAYYAELARLTYTTDNAQTVVRPNLVNYNIDSNFWRSGTIQLKN